MRREGGGEKGWAVEGGIETQEKKKKSTYDRGRGVSGVGARYNVLVLQKVQSRGKIKI
jgi:hypothetical protein